MSIMPPMSMGAGGGDMDEMMKKMMDGMKMGGGSGEMMSFGGDMGSMMSSSGSKMMSSKSSVSSSSSSMVSIWARNNFFTCVLNYLLPGICIYSLEHLEDFC